MKNDRFFITKFLQLFLINVAAFEDANKTNIPTEDCLIIQLFSEPARIN